MRGMKATASPACGLRQLLYTLVVKFRKFKIIHNLTKENGSSSIHTTNLLFIGQQRDRSDPDFGIKPFIPIAE